MATNNGLSSTLSFQTTRTNDRNIRNTTKTNYQIQSTPPLSIRQFLRATNTDMIIGTKRWQPCGIYHPPAFHSYLSPAVRKTPKRSEPIWHSPGCYVDKRPTPLSPEKRTEKTVKEPIWHPPGKVQYQPVPYFDPPCLRWSLQDLSRSMSEMKSMSFRTSSNTSTLRKSEEDPDK